MTSVAATQVSQLQSKFRGYVAEGESYRKEERYTYAIIRFIEAVNVLRQIDDIVHERPVKIYWRTP